MSCENFRLIARLDIKGPNLIKGVAENHAGLHEPELRQKLEKIFEEIVRESRNL
jgi:hypothetical protein